MVLIGLVSSANIYVYECQKASGISYDAKWAQVA